MTNQIKIENIQHARFNGKDVTMFDVYTKRTDSNGVESWVFSSNEMLNGTIKRESTIIRKINA